MNAPALPRHFLPLPLFTGYEIADGLLVDLYGDAPDADDGCFIVDTVRISGTEHDITALISARKLELMGLWLDCQDNPCAMHVANEYSHEITRPF